MGKNLLSYDNYTIYAVWIRLEQEWNLNLISSQMNEEKYHYRCRGERQRYGLNRMECGMRRRDVRAS